MFKKSFISMFALVICLLSSLFCFTACKKPVEPSKVELKNGVWVASATLNNKGDSLTTVKELFEVIIINDSNNAIYAGPYSNYEETQISFQQNGDMLNFSFLDAKSSAKIVDENTLFVTMVYETDTYYTVFTYQENVVIQPGNYNSALSPEKEISLNILSESDMVITVSNQGVEPNTVNAKYIVYGNRIFITTEDLTTKYFLIVSQVEENAFKFKHLNQNGNSLEMEEVCEEGLFYRQ